MNTVIDQLAELYMTEEELASLFGVAPERIRDLRSHHNTGKQKFMESHKVSAKCHLYHINDILDYIKSTRSDFKSHLKPERVTIENVDLSSRKDLK